MNSGFLEENSSGEKCVLKELIYRLLMQEFYLAGSPTYPESN